MSKLGKKFVFGLPFIVTCLGLFWAVMTIFGCAGGGGGSASSDTATDPGPTVSVIEGYIFIPSASATTSAPAQGNASSGPSLSSPYSTSETSLAGKAPRRATIPVTGGYVGVNGATVLLSGTNKATTTDSQGYYRFNIGQNEKNAFGTKTIIITKEDQNVRLEFKTDVVSGESKMIYSEVDTTQAVNRIKETLTNKVQTPHIYLSGTIISASTKEPLSNATVEAQFNSATNRFTKSVKTDSFGVFQFTDLTDGSFTLSVSKDNFKSLSKDVIVSSSYTVTNIDFSLPGTFIIYTPSFLAKVTEVTLYFSTSVPTTYTLEYGSTQDYGNTYISNLLNKSSEVTLRNLAPKTLYHFKIKAIDQYGNNITTDDLTFETLDPNANTNVPPVINSNYTYRKTHNSITVTFNTNTSAYGQLQYSVFGSDTKYLYPADNSEVGPKTAFEITLSSLDPGQTYKVWIIAKNSTKSASATEGPITITTDSAPDLTPPSITGTSVSNVKAKEATISWVATDDRSGTNGSVHYGPLSFPTLEYNNTTTPPRPVFKYQYASAIVNPELSFGAKTVTLTNLTPETTYYYRPESDDASGNMGTTTSELQFTTAAPGTNLALVLSESPAAGQISPGEDAKILRLKLTGSTEEVLTISKIVFTQTGSVPYNSITKLTVTDGVNSWYVTSIVGSEIEVKFDSPKLIIPKNNSIYLTMNMILNTAALNPGGTPKDVKLKLAANTTSKNYIELAGDVYNDLIMKNITGLPLESSAQAVNVGQLELSALDITELDPTKNILVALGQKDVTLFKFKVKSLYEDINVTQVQLSQTGTSTVNDYSNVRLYDGITSLAVGEASGNNILFRSDSGAANGLIKVAKGTTEKILSVIGDIQLNASPGSNIKLSVSTDSILGVGSYSKQSVSIIGKNSITSVAGSLFTIGDSALTAALAYNSPVSRTIQLGSLNQNFTNVTLTAGGAEDVDIYSMLLTFQGDSSFANFKLYITDEKGNLVYSTDSVTLETSGNVKTVKAYYPTRSFITIPKNTTKTLYISGDISSDAAEVGKSIQISVNNNSDIYGKGSQTRDDRYSTGTATGQRHTIIGSLTLTSLEPQPFGNVLAGSAANKFLQFKVKPTGEDVYLQSFNFSLTGNYAILDKLKVIRISDSAEVAVYPSISGDVVTFTPSSTLTLARDTETTFWLVGDITKNATSTNTIKFDIKPNGIIVTGKNSSQTYKTSETVTGGTTGIVTESFTMYSDSSTTALSPDSAVIGDPASQTLFAFKFSPNSGQRYYASQITIRQLGTATLGVGQDVSNFDFTVDGSSKGVVTVSGSNILITFSSSTDLKVPFTAGTTTPVTCALKGTIQNTAQSGKSVKFYTDNTLVKAYSDSSGNALTGTGSITGKEISMNKGALTVNSRTDKPVSSDIVDSTLKDLFSFDISAASIEDLEIYEIRLTYQGNLNDFDSTSVTVKAYKAGDPATLDATYSGGSVTVSGSIFSVKPVSGSDYLKLPKGTARKILVSGKARSDFSNALSGNQYSFNIANNGDISARGSYSTQTMNSSGIDYGNLFTIKQGYDVTAPAVTSVAVSEKTTTSFKVTWSTLTESSTSIVEYGTTTGVYTATVENTVLTKSHSVILSGLTAYGTYFFRVHSKDSAGNDGVSAETSVQLVQSKTASLAGALSSSTPAAANVNAGSRVLIGKFDLTNTRNYTDPSAAGATIGDDITIKSLALTKSGTYPNSSIKKVEVTDGTTTFTYSSAVPTSNEVAFTGLSYTLPMAGGTNLTNTATFSVYATLDSIGTGTLIFSLNPQTQITGMGATYGTWVTPTPNSTLTSTTQTIVLGQLCLTPGDVVEDSNGVGISPGTVSMPVMKFNLQNLNNIEDISLNSVKISSVSTATGVLGTDIGNLRLFDDSNLNASLASGTASTSSYTFGGSGQSLITVPRNGTKKFTVYADIPSGASTQKVLQFQMLPSDIAATNISSNTVSVMLPTTANYYSPPQQNANNYVYGNRYVTGNDALSVVIDSSSPSAGNVVPGSTSNKLMAAFSVTKGAGQGVNLTYTSIKFTGNLATPDTNLTNCVLYDGSVSHNLTYNSGSYYTSETIEISAGQTRVLSVYASVKYTASANSTIKFKLDTGGLAGTGTGSGGVITSTGSAESSAQTTVGSVTIANDLSTPSGNIAIGSTETSLFSFYVTPTIENSLVSSLKLTIGEKGSFSDSSDAVVIDPTTLKLYKSSTLLASSPTISGSTAIFSNFNLTAGSSHNLILKGTVKTASTSGATVSFSVASASDLSATGYTSSQALSVSGTASGNSLSAAIGSLAISDAKTIDTKEILIGGYTVDNSESFAALVKITAANETVEVNKIKVEIVGNDITNDFGDINNFQIGWVSKTLETTPVTISRSSNVLTFSKDSGILTVAGGSNETILISAKPSKTAAVVNRSYTMNFSTADFEGKGATSGQTIKSSGTITGSSQTLLIGKLGASVDSTSPGSKTILKGKTNETLAVFKLESANSSSGTVLENINLSQVKLTTSPKSLAGFSNFKIKIGATSYSISQSNDTTGEYIFNLGTPVSITKNGGSVLVTVVTDVDPTCIASSILVKLDATGTKGTGVNSGRDINVIQSGVPNKNTDQSAASHTITTNDFTASANISNPASLNLLEGSTVEVLRVDLAAGASETLKMSNSNTFKINLEGNVLGTAVTYMEVLDSAEGILLTANNPFATSSTFTANFNMDYSASSGGYQYRYYYPSKSDYIKVYVKLASGTAQGSTVKLTIPDAGLNAAGTVSGNPSIASKNSVSSNTHYFRSNSVAISANTYTTENFQRNDTNKTILDFNVTAGQYQDIYVKKLHIKTDTSVNTASFTTDLTTMGVMIDGTAHFHDGGNYNIVATTGPNSLEITFANDAIVKIPKGTSKQFKIIASILNTATSGRVIKLKTDYVDYTWANDFTPTSPNGSISGSATGNAHYIYNNASITIEESPLSPDSSTLTLNPINNGSSGTFSNGTVGVFLVKVGSQMDVYLKTFKFSNVGSTKDISSIEGRVTKNYTELNSDVSTNYRFTGTIDSDGNYSFSTTGVALLSKNTTYYLAVYSKIVASPTLGTSVKLYMDASQSMMSVETLENALSINYSGAVYGNPISVDSPEVTLSVKCTEIAGLSLEWPYNTTISTREVMQINVSNSNYTEFNMDSLGVILYKTDSIENLFNLGFSVDLYELKGGLEEFVAYAVTGEVIFGPTGSSTADQNLTLNQATKYAIAIPAGKQAFAKGQARKFSVRIGSNSSAYSQATGTFPQTPVKLTSYPTFYFGVWNVHGKYPNISADNKFGGSEFSRIPTDPLRKFYFR